MKILLVGVLDVPWSTNISMKNALERSGHTVVSFNYRTIESEYRKKCFLSDTVIDTVIEKGCSFLRSELVPFQTSWYFKRSGRREMNSRLLETVRGGSFDLMLLCKTDTVDHELITEFNKHVRTFYFYMDAMEHEKRINAKAYAVKANWASATFSDVAAYFKKAGANAHWITQGLDTDVFSPAESHAEYDVIFVGTKTEKRSRYITALKDSGIRVDCFGAGWENSAVFQEELVDIYRRSKVVLNFCREGAGFSIRVFQVMGTGAFLLSEYCTDLEEFFVNGEHLDWFGAENELVRKAKQYVGDKDNRSRIAQKGCAIVHDKHSWDAVMGSIIEIVNNG